MAHLKGMKRFAAHTALIAATFFGTTAHAQNIGDILEASVLSGWQRADGKHVAALHIDLEDGWKTYWRSPGDAGIPPHFVWKGSRNLEKVAVSWPTPHRILQGGVQTIGYEDTLTLPLTLTPSDANAPISLKGEITIGVCRDVCVPMTLKVRQDLPGGQSNRDPRIVAALTDRPHTAAEASVGRVACRISPLADGLSIRAEVDLPRTGGQEIAVIETANPMVWVAQAKTKRSGGRLIAETQMYHVEGRSFALDRDGLRITVLGTNRAVDIQGCPAG